MKHAYRYRFYPIAEQAHLLNRTFGCVRLVWNELLALRKERWLRERRGLTYCQASALLTALKQRPDRTFLNEVSSVPLQQVLRPQDRALSAFFAKQARYPKFKSRQGRQAAEFTASGFRLKDGHLFLAKLKAPLAVRWSRPLPPGAVPSTVTVTRDAAGRWFVSLLVEDPGVTPLAPLAETVGVDLGLTDFAVLSTGERMAHPKHYNRHMARLAREQRRLSRKQKGSANRRKAKAKVARAHARVVDARRDFLHKLSTDLIRRFQRIAVEDLKVAGMVRNRSLARAIATSGWAEFRAQLAYKAEWYGRTLVVVDRYCPSSKTCSGCGWLREHLDLATRAWSCPACGARHDRDLNAAINLNAAAGRAVNVCGADVRPGHGTFRVGPLAAKQKCRVVRPGIPSL
jgi:putative transposase